MSEQDVETRYNPQSSDTSGKTSVNGKGVFRKNVVNYFKEYCEATGIHGFRYIGESRTICEKLWWLTMFVISLILCVLCILPVYTKWEENPVIISFSTREKAITNIPLPAVTICSESKVNSSVFDYENAIKRKINVTDLTEKEKHYLDTLSNVCNGPKKSDSVLNYSRTEEFLDILREVSPDFSVISCVYLSEPYNCEDFFKPIFTDEGFCYTFNILDRTELYNENVVHYKDFLDMKSSSYPTYSFSALLPGAKFGLTFVLKAENKKVETMCRGSVEGYRISIHESTSIPSPSLDYSHIPYDQTFSASITVNEIKTAEAVKKYSPDIRYCYLPSERKLKYFKVYNENNCILECLTNITLRECKCVLFYMPRENDTRICQQADFRCTEKAESKATVVRVLDTDKQYFDVGWIIEDVQNQSCRCLPACSDISYTTSISRTKWNWTKEIESGYYEVDDSFNITDYHLSKVNVFLSKSNFIGSERNEFYGPTDFLANVGGLLGLFTGFSVLSLIEIFYFLSIRLICNVCLFGRWAGQANP